MLPCRSLNRSLNVRLSLSRPPSVSPLPQASNQSFAPSAVEATAVRTYVAPTGYSTIYFAKFEAVLRLLQQQALASNSCPLRWSLLHNIGSPNPIVFPFQTLLRTPLLFTSYCSTRDSAPILSFLVYAEFVRIRVQSPSLWISFRRHPRTEASAIRDECKATSVRLRPDFCVSCRSTCYIYLVTATVRENGTFVCGQRRIARQQFHPQSGHTAVCSVFRPWVTNLLLCESYFSQLVLVARVCPFNFNVDLVGLWPVYEIEWVFLETKSPLL